MKAHRLITGFLSIVCSVACAAPASDILVPGTRLFTESITSTADGSVIIGAMGPGAIFRAKRGAATAELWIESGTDGLASVLGVLADERAGTLWACSFTNAPPEVAAPPSALHAFDLGTGMPKGKWPLPSARAICNDIAVGSDGTVYVTDTENMAILRLAPGASSLEMWAGNGAFGPRSGMLDGIAVVRGDTVVVNTVGTSRLFSVPIEAGGQSGQVLEVKLDRPLAHPDGHRSIGNDELLLVDAAEGGRLVRIALTGSRLDAGKVTTMASGFADGPASVTVVGDTAYVIEAQFETVDKLPPRPFRARAVSLAH